MIFLLSRWLMRHFGAVIGVDRIEMLHGRHRRAVSGIIASQFFSDEPAWFKTLPFQKPTEKPFSRLLIAPALHKNINHITILIHCSPQILSLPLDRDKDFVAMPRIA